MTDFTQFAASNKAAAESLFSAAGQAFEGVEKLSALNLQVAKTTLAEAFEGAQAALSAKNPADLFKLQAAAVQAAPEKLLSYGRHLKDIFGAATEVQRSAAEAQVADVQAKFLAAVNGALKNAPGSENTLALVQSAVDAANKAYDQVSKTSKEVAVAVEANLAKVTESVTKGSSNALATIAA